MTKLSDPALSVRQKLAAPAFVRIPHFVRIRFADFWIMSCHGRDPYLVRPGDARTQMAILTQQNVWTRVARGKFCTEKF